MTDNPPAPELTDESSRKNYVRLRQKTREQAGELRVLRREMVKNQRQLQFVLDHLRLAEQPSTLTTDPIEMIQQIQSKRHCTLQEIGHRIGLSQSQMSRIARGQCTMKAAAQTLLQRMAEEIGG